MDSLTQVVLGATVGEAALGKKIGRKALLFGAMAGTLPDLDVLAYPFWNDVERLTYHRGASHSLLVLPIAAVLCAWLTHRFFSKEEVRFRDWYRLWFFGLVTHPLLDVFTTYGTQLLWPITDFPFALNTIFIIDPLYSLPLIAATVVLSLRTGELLWRRKVVWTALALSTAYLGCATAAKLSMNAKVSRELAAQSMNVDRWMTQTAPFNILLWRVIAIDRDGERIWESHVSILDGNHPIQFRSLPRTTIQSLELESRPDIERLIWFSKGFYTVETLADSRVFYDLRFGFSGRYFFGYEIARQAAVGFQPVQANQVSRPEVSLAQLGYLWRRIWSASTASEP